MEGEVSQLLNFGNFDDTLLKGQNSHVGCLPSDPPPSRPPHFDPS